MTSRVLVALRIAAPPSRVFTAFTAEIGQWWRPHGLFKLNGRGDRPARHERPAPAAGSSSRTPTACSSRSGTSGSGTRPTGWSSAGGQPPLRPGRETEVHVRFEHADGGTRVVVEHLGWDGIPQEHAARHSFPLLPFQQRLAQWWQALLDSLATASTT